MIKTKYVVGDVVTLNGKALVVRAVSASSYELHQYCATYLLSDDKLYLEEELV